MLSRLEADGTNFEDISTKASKLEHMLAGIPIVGQIRAPSNQFKNTVENPIKFNCACDVAPMEHAEEDIHNICVVGEIVTAES